MTRKIYEKKIYTTRPQQLGRKVYDRANNVVPVYSGKYNVSNVTLSAAGTGYAANDALSIVGSTGDTPAVITVKTVSDTGEVLTFTFTAGTYAANGSGEKTIASSTGTGATFNVVMTKQIVGDDEDIEQ